MTDTSLGSVTPDNSRQPRRRPETVVTSENLAEFQKHKLDISDITTKPKEVVADEKTEIKEETDSKEVDVKQEKPEEENEDHLDDENKKVIKKTNSKIEKRFAELTTQRKEAIARAEAAERKASDLEAKLKPVEVTITEDSPKPKASDFTDAFQYAESLAEWTTKKALRERDESDKKSRADADREKVIETWKERVDVVRKEIPDYVEKLSNSTVVVSDTVRDAILESEQGPKILYHLADNPDVAEKIGKMTVGKALIALGKLEATLEKASVKEEEPDASAAATTRVQISKAPSPISPLKGASAPADLPINSKGEWTGSLDQYKAARRAGKIK